MKSKATGCGSVSTVISSIVLLCISSIIILIIKIVILIEIDSYIIIKEVKIIITMMKIMRKIKIVKKILQQKTKKQIQ